MKVFLYQELSQSLDGLDPREKLANDPILPDVANLVGKEKDVYIYDVLLLNLDMFENLCYVNGCNEVYY